MMEYINLLTSKFHLLLLFSLTVGVGFSAYARARLNPSFDSPLSWKQDNPSIWFRFLILEEGFFYSSMVGLGIILIIQFKWWFGLIFLFEYILLPGIILGLSKSIFPVRYPDRWLLRKSISFLFSDIAVYYLIFSYLPFAIKVFSYEIPVWTFIVVAGSFSLFKFIFSIIKNRYAYRDVGW
jgi:hypothetical protein